MSQVVIDITDAKEAGDTASGEARATATTATSTPATTEELTLATATLPAAATELAPTHDVLLITQKGLYRLLSVLLSIVALAMIILYFCNVVNSKPWVIIWTVIFGIAITLAFPMLTSYLYRKEEIFADLIDVTAKSATERHVFQNSIKIVMCICNGLILGYIMHYFAVDWVNSPTEPEIIFGALSGVLALYYNVQDRIFIGLVRAVSCCLRNRRERYLATLGSMNRLNSSNSVELHTAVAAAAAAATAMPASPAIVETSK